VTVYAVFSDKELIKKRWFNTDLRQHFFIEEIINQWNSSEDDLVCSDSLNSFKNALDKIWKNNSLPMGLL